MRSSVLQSEFSHRRTTMLAPTFNNALLTMRNVHAAATGPSTPPSLPESTMIDEDMITDLQLTPKIHNKSMKQSNPMTIPTLELPEHSDGSFRNFRIMRLLCSVTKTIRFTLYHYMPFLERLELAYVSLPCHIRALILCGYVVIKFVISFYVLSFVLNNGQSFHRKTHNKITLQAVSSHQTKNNNELVTITNNSGIIGSVTGGNENPFRILHLVTTLAEYNNGQRGTVHGEDRLMELLVPVLQYNVESMLAEEGWEVDVFLVLGFKLMPERRKMIEESLPEGVGLEVWDDATPYSYDVRHGKKEDHLTEITRALARQHRFVLKDKVESYDFFSIWEDDMLVTAEHIKNFLDMSNTLDELVTEAPETSSDSESIFGTLTRKQLQRLIPGFVRVEVLTTPGARGVDVTGLDKDTNVSIDAKYCCALPKNFQHLSNPPKEPNNDGLMMWETGIKGLGLRELPKLGWVALQTGPKNVPKDEDISSYWSGANGAFPNDKRPSGGDPQMFGQQGGYMVTRQQIEFLQNVACKGGFFPPFKDRPFVNDGLHMANVEFWSGGYQHFGGSSTFAQGCNMQRVLSLEPERFSRQLLYHTANNKQHTIPQKQRLVNANTVFQQLYTVKKNALVAKP